jgi:hypothetical protein
MKNVSCGEGSAVRDESNKEILDWTTSMYSISLTGALDWYLHNQLAKMVRFNLGGHGIVYGVAPVVIPLDRTGTLTM